MGWDAFLSFFFEILDRCLNGFMAAFNISMKPNKKLDSGCQAGYTWGWNASLIKGKLQRSEIHYLGASGVLSHRYFSKPEQVAPKKVLKVNLTSFNAPQPRLS